MYRPKSTDVWFNLPEVVAAYQPVACPGGELLARINVANNQQSPSLHRLIPVVAPVFDPRYGWQFDGATTYFNGGPSFAVNQRASFFWQWSGWTAGIPYGWYQTYAAFVAAQIIPSGVLSRNGDARFPVTNAPAFAAGNYGVAGRNCFRNGKQEPSLIPSAARSEIVTPKIGATFNFTTASPSIDGYFDGRIQAGFVSYLPLSAPAAAQLAHQMTWCHLNPDWSAWGRRRRYYYAPSAAGIAWRGVGRNSSPVGGSIGIGRSQP